MQTALYYTVKDDLIQCELCPHNCKLKDHQVGRCRVRKNIDGKLISLNYGEVSALQIDPIEKKPLYHWKPGTKIFSIGSHGCNMRCGFCQNHEISLDQPEIVKISPAKVVEKALSHMMPSIAYTYNEPTIFFEMMLETAKLAHENGIKNVVVTNGLINEKPLLELLPWIDAMNIDLKTYSDEIYQRLGGTSVADVLNTIKLASSACHVEVTILIVPQVSDDPVEFEKLMIRLKEVAPEVVLHLSRYFPRFLYDEPATDISQMRKLKEIALGYFKKVYLGNVQ